MSAYRLALLVHFERTCTTRYIDLVEGSEVTDPQAKLDALVQAVSADLADDSPEVAIRAWAVKDDDTRATMERVDGRRQVYLASLLAALHPDRDDSELVSRMLYLTLIGARHVVPPVPVPELERIFGRLLALSGASALA